MEIAAEGWSWVGTNQRISQPSGPRGTMVPCARRCRVPRLLRRAALLSPSELVIWGCKGQVCETVCEPADQCARSRAPARHRPRSAGRGNGLQSTHLVEWGYAGVRGPILTVRTAEGSCLWIRRVLVRAQEGQLQAVEAFMVLDRLTFDRLSNYGMCRECLCQPRALPDGLLANVLRLGRDRRRGLPPPVFGFN